MKKTAAAIVAATALAAGLATHDFGTTVQIEAVTQGQHRVETWRVYKDGRSELESVADGGVSP